MTSSKSDGMSNTEDYSEIAEHILTNDEPNNSPVIQFVASIFEHYDRLASLEADLAEHELPNFGLTEGDLDRLNGRFESLRGEYVTIQKIIADPGTYLEQYHSIEGRVEEDDCTRLRSAVHKHGDVDRVLLEIREAQSRIRNTIVQKRNQIYTRRGLLISIISMIVATGAFLNSIL